MRTHHKTRAWPILSVVLFCVLGVSSKAIAQDGSTQEVEALLQQVIKLRSAGRFGEAIPLAQRFLAIVEKVLGSEDPNTAISLNDLAALYQETEDYQQAESLYRRALGIFEKARGPEHPDTAALLNNLAFLYRKMEVYAQAEPLYLRALRIIEKARGAEHPDTAATLNNLAALYHARSVFVKAESLYWRALAITEKVLGSEHSETAQLLNNLGALYHDTGAYTQAEPLLQQALAIWEKTLHPNTAITLNNLAEVYRSRGAYTQAEPLFRRALAITEKVLGPEHSNTARSLNDLALLYHDMGAYAQAEPLLQRALAIREKVLGPHHPDTAGSLNNMAFHYWANGDLTKALPFVSRAQTVEEKNLSTFFLVGSESRKQSYLTGLRGQTFANVSLSLMMAGQAAIGLQSVMTSKGRVLDAMSESIARVRTSVKPEDQAIVEEFIDVAQQRSTLTYQGIGDLKPEIYRQRLQELAQKQEQLETDLSTLSTEFHQAMVPITLAAVQAAISKGAALIEWFRYHPFDPKAKDIQSRWGKPRYVAYVLMREGEPVVVDVGEAGSIDQMVHDFRNGLSDRTSTYVKDVAKELGEKVYKPLQQYVGDAKHLLLSPDGELNMLPFAALMDSSGAYLGSKKEISYLTSGRDLLRFQTPSVEKVGSVIVADPDYGKTSTVMAKGEVSDQPTRSVDFDRGGMGFERLPGTAKEAEKLKTVLKVPDDKVLTQSQATEDRIKGLHGPRILHVATHGFFLKDNELPNPTLSQGGSSQDKQPVLLSENPLLRSGLALAGANLRQSGEKDDGILTAAEVAQMDLRGTQLVVLSACETSVGDVQNGEGVYGLRRALVLAGAESQVTSLWKVSDDATKDLMVDYYQRLLKGEARSEALRNAQLTMMKSKDRSHPYYWAAFVPIGDWRPLVQSKY